MNLTEWAHAQGIHVTTAYRWYREGMLPVPAREAGLLILVSPGTAAVPGAGRGGLYARVSYHDQEAGAGPAGRPLAGVGGAGRPARGPGRGRGRVRGERLPARGAPAAGLPGVPVVVAGHRGRLGRVNTGLAEAALAAHRRRLVVLDESEVTGALVRDVTGVLTWFCARRYGRPPARDRALEAVGCAQRDIGPRAVPAAGSTSCGGAG